MADRLASYLTKSVAKWLIDDLSIDCYVASPDFNYDRKPDPSNPRNTIARPLPFAVVELVSETLQPFTVSNNILHEAIIIINVMVCGSSYSNLVNLTSDVKQSLAGAAHPSSGKVGVPLYDFGTPEGSFYEMVNAVQINNLGTANYFGPSDTTELGNRKFQSVLPVEFSAYKDKNAELLENLGNISINE